MVKGMPWRVGSTRQGAFPPLREATSFALGLRLSAQCALSIRVQGVIASSRKQPVGRLRNEMLKRRKSDRCRAHVQYR